MRIELSDAQMGAVNGGVTFYEDNTLGYFSSSEHPYHFKDKALCKASMAIHLRDRSFTDGDDCDAYLIQCLLDEGLIWLE